ncbi:transferases, transferring glycosyl groups isoform X2 [Tasmannia lanceolata]|uniref:transferases, transferring glycosyl groups isoform X2 n=1 Tax=Tasmannia lanceolata TaxID=3420 RepID=UPI0040636AFC
MENPQSQPKDRRSEALGDLQVLSDELLCAILENLTPHQLARLSCVSSVMYILCKEEPLWMTLCLNSAGGLLEYKNSWKETTLHRQHPRIEFDESCRKPLHFDGFNSLFLYKRWYRRHTALDAFSTDRGDLERKKNLSLEEFRQQYDGRKPVLLTELAETWPARSTWTTDQLLRNYGDTAFRLSQKSGKKITMKVKDYVSYMNRQHDEDPLYIFDDQFGEAAPDLLKDYNVPHLFEEDLFDVLDRDQRPPFRWLIIGPERSGASWHVDPALTSAWNTLLSGRKRWALYPPGKVPLGVTVHVNDEDGDVNIETPSSLQWWLDVYPLLADHDKPLEFTQLPGETVFVPSGWWHCVLNLEVTLAVTQNFVNTSNFEFVCLDMAPGHHHKGVCRAGLLAIHENSFGNVKADLFSDTDRLNFPDMTRKEKRLRLSKPGLNPCINDINGHVTNGDVKITNNLQNQAFFYDIKFLSMFLDEDRDHYNSIWSPSNCIGDRDLRQWLHKLWVVKPGMRELIWKGACLALNADRWFACIAEICASHNLPSPLDGERFPVGTGSNPVYLIGDHAIKIYVEGGLESSIHSLGTELEFYGLLSKVKSPLRDHIPEVLASGILVHENDSYRTMPWDGKGVPDAISMGNFIFGNHMGDGFSFGVWSKTQFEFEKAGNKNGPSNSTASTRTWPYIITKRCKGDIFAHLRDKLSRDAVLNLASFLGDQLRNLHLLPLPSLHDALCSDVKQKIDLTRTTINNLSFSIPVEWELFIGTIAKRKKDVSDRLAKWGDPIPSILIEKVEEYIPQNPAMLLNIFKDENGLHKVGKSQTWVHSDIMDDNIQMEPCLVSHCLDENVPSSIFNGTFNGYDDDGKKRECNPSHILDFSDLSIGDPLCDLIPIHLDVFRGDSSLLKKLLESYKLPLVRRPSQHGMLLVLLYLT